MPASTPLILRKSRMRRRARTDLCGGRSAMVVPTATTDPLLPEVRSAAMQSNARLGQVHYIEVILRDFGPEGSRVHRHYCRCLMHMSATREILRKLRMTLTLANAPFFLIKSYVVIRYNCSCGTTQFPE